MPQLHCYVPKETAEKLKRRAEAEGVSLSRYVAHVLNREIALEWPAGFFEEVLGGWRGEPLTRPPSEDWEERKELDVTSDWHSARHQCLHRAAQRYAGSGRPAEALLP